jgi:hypothetical protein
MHYFAGWMQISVNLLSKSSNKFANSSGEQDTEKRDYHDANCLPWIKPWLGGSSVRACDVHEDQK